MEKNKDLPLPLLIVVENRDEIKTEFTKWLAGVAFNHEVGGIKFWDKKRRPIWHMRHEMIKESLQRTNFEHILFVDTDVIPPKGFIEKLLFYNCDAVSGYYCDITGEPMIRKDGKLYKGEGLKEVDVFGMGLSLIKREVLEKVEYPKPDNILTPDADIEFCREVKKAGFKIFCDFSARGTHLLQGFF